MLGRTKDQIRSTEQVNAAMAACKTLKLDALIIVGGIDYATFYGSLWIFQHKLARAHKHTYILTCALTFEGVTSNTDAAQLAETFTEAKCQTKVCMSWGSSLYLIHCYLIWMNNLTFFQVFLQYSNINLCILFSILSSHCGRFILSDCPFLQVVGVPVTLNGDLKNQFVETNVGFDTICKVLVQLCQSFERNSFEDHICFFTLCRIYI